MSVNTYWIVVGRLAANPPRRHESILTARDEAKRLARNNRGEVFTVFQATNSYEAPPDIIETIFDDIPF